MKPTAFSPQPAPGLPDLIVFDGACALCSHWARWVHENDPGRRLRFVAIQSPAGRALAGRFAVDADNPETNALVLGGVAYFKADAIWRLLVALGWRGAAVLALAPRPLRDWAYDWVARHRYQWSGEVCSVLDGGLRARLVADEKDLAAA